MIIAGGEWRVANWTCFLRPYATDRPFPSVIAVQFPIFNHLDPKIIVGSRKESSRVFECLSLILNLYLSSILFYHIINRTFTTLRTNPLAAGSLQRTGYQCPSHRRCLSRKNDPSHLLPSQHFIPFAQRCHDISPLHFDQMDWTTFRTRCRAIRWSSNGG